MAFARHVFSSRSIINAVPCPRLLSTPIAQPTAQVIQEVNVGHEVGNRVPGFELSLEDGTRVTTVGLVRTSQTAYLQKVSYHFMMETLSNGMSRGYPCYCDWSQRRMPVR